MAIEISLRLPFVRGRGLIWRSLILGLVFSCGLLGFVLGAGASERAGIPEAEIFVKIYYALSLFVLGGVDIGMPEGGPPVARSLLWLAYFAAPAITTASVIEGVLRAFAPERWQLRRLRGHTIIAGAGGIGQLCLRRLRARNPRQPIVVVELQQDHRARAAIRQHAHLLVGDIRADAMLDALGLDHAERVFLLTGDDFANLDAAAKILQRVPALGARTVVHVADLHFLRVMSDSRVAGQCAIFNSHDIAATHLVRAEILDHFQRTEQRDVVVLAGFGRFGQSVLANLQELAGGKFVRVIVIDFEAGKRAAVFAEQVGFQGFYERELVDGDLCDPRTWQVVQGIEECEPVFILGSGDDGANLRTALWVKRDNPHAYVVARTFGRSSFADELGREGGFQVFSVAELVERSMPRSWFRGRRGEGLSRSRSVPPEDVLY